MAIVEKEYIHHKIEYGSFESFRNAKATEFIKSEPSQMTFKLLMLMHVVPKLYLDMNDSAFETTLLIDVE